jgi:hypothetical protein
VANLLEDWILVIAILLQFYGCLEHKRLAEKSGWMLPFLLWTCIAIGMSVPRIMSEMVQLGFLPYGSAREAQSWVYAMNSICVVWAAKCFSKHMDKWIDRVTKLEHSMEARDDVTT